SANNAGDTGEKHSHYSRRTSERVGCTSSLQKGVEMRNSQTHSPCGLSDKQELPAELQCEDTEAFETGYQKEGESTAGIFVPS
ncbi:hypothetical protein N326_00529, partial [Eurypyga helias]